MLWILLYLVLATLVVFLSIKLSDYVDALDKKTKLSGALLGGILLAAVTSLPELFTSLSGTLIAQQNNMVLGNILGSDFFDIIIFGFVYFIFFKKFTEGKVGKQHYYTCLFTAFMLIAITIAGFVIPQIHWLIGNVFNPMSIVIFIIYMIFIWKTPKTEEKEDTKEIENKKAAYSYSIKKIWILFTICSVILIGASITVTLVTKKVVEFLGIGETFGGALFLGVATSLPEVTATISLCKKKNFDAAYGDIFGSCVFNIIILGIADIFSFVPGQPLYQIDQSSFLLLIGTAFALIVSVLSIMLIRSKYFKNTITNRVILYFIGVVMIGSYIAYLILNFVNLGIPFAPFPTVA